MTTSPQCLQAVPSCAVPDLDDVGDFERSAVIILTGTSLLELAFDATEPCSVARGWRWGCGWRDQMSMTDLGVWISFLFGRSVVGGRLGGEEAAGNYSL